MRSISAVLAPLIISSSLCAQNQTGVTRHYPAIGAPSPAVHAEYDGKYDKTILQFDPTPLDPSLRLSALVALDGRVVRKEAPGVVLTLWSTAPQKRFQEKRTVIMTIDKAAPISLGAAELTANPRPGFSEILMTSVSLDQWLALANAHAVRLSVGDFSYQLTPQCIAAIRDFASRMAPSAK